MNEQEFENALMAMLSEAPDDYTSGEALDIEEVVRVRRFKQRGPRAGSRGLILTMIDGSEFQVTIAKTR